MPHIVLDIWGRLWGRVPTPTGFQIWQEWSARLSEKLSHLACGAQGSQDRTPVPLHQTRETFASQKAWKRGATLTVQQKPESQSWENKLETERIDVCHQNTTSAPRPCSRF